ncbi:MULTISPECIES: lycopene cyclase domain-containing protein [Haloarcula]|uniref:Lycopene cyclase n=1 Tax=Haloarcula pellucida TaxID=1427151 RepID=A0A830GRJ0_9EURY|nr:MULTISPECIES: lycopene cyclase domain-containing protein [Halomicroarcula]MBX0350195.1 lycopene cyclase domain-containing protein [Halomicroarcula pellucida]MDS0277703.1 lycopene cyclase domain-containing protein [Halomicroarcula sp. S1AR25-4]GGO00840.1 lycopene cyclase [Halomicroarcula pellucida]
MTPSLTYLQFHAVLVLPVLAGLALTARYRLASRRVVLSGTALLAALALVYTTPWDNYLVARGVWWYGAGTVLTRLWAAPLGEYLFFVFQPVGVGLWVARYGVDTTRPLAIPVPTRALGLLAAGLVAAVGVALLDSPDGLYLGSLLVWSVPILAIQWAFGWPFLVAEWRTVALGTLVPTLYLWVADRIALALGVWTLSDQYTTGLAIPLLGLPVEEAVFFLLTSLFVVQGLVLFAWLCDRWG